jgi:hypothetical protein
MLLIGRKKFTHVYGVQGCLMQACFIEIHLVLRKKQTWSDTFLTDLVHVIWSKRMLLGSCRMFDFCIQRKTKKYGNPEYKSIIIYTGCASTGSLYI